MDNGSTDNSSAVFQEELSKNNRQENFELVAIPKNQGYGWGILVGLAAADTPILAWTHADMQTPPNDILVALDAFQTVKDGDVVIKGKRKNRRFLEAFFTWGMEVLASFALGTKLNDINAQPKMFSRAFYERIYKNAPHDFSLDLYWLYHAKKHSTIKTIPVYFNKRLHGEAKGGGSFKTRIKLIKRTFKYIFELRTKLKKENP